ncbi:MAG: hypothetical protein K2P48_03995 [Lachnospiraceae bacterium]|nr:hypothetical protein [Lachnospiraceae bacterium]
MYRKEIIYLGLYKEGSRIGNAGFVKVENRETESRLDLKLRNIPFSINGRFPVRIYNGADWKEINGVSVQEGEGSWADKIMDSAQWLQVQIMLPGGYLLEGKSKNAIEDASGVNTGGIGNLSAAEDRQELPHTQQPIQESLQEPVQYNQQQNMQRSAQEPVQQSKPHNTVQFIPVMQSRSRDQTSEDSGSTYTDWPDHDDGSQSIQSFPDNRFRREVSVNKQGDEAESSRAESVYSGNANGAQDMDKADRTERDKKKTIVITEELQRPNVTGNVVDQRLLQESSAAYSLKEDKWEQILDSYEKIHPYGDERVYVKLEPKDFIILQSKYQHLVNNSFLLHGFYNYRYVILGKEQDYYLGVPGVFYEREKMVALMFGFEAFECPGGTARAGEFGYYLRKVEL